MDISEMKKFFELANRYQSPQIKQKVLDTSEEGLLFSTKADTPEGKTYILLPAGENYEKIQEAVKNLTQ